MASRSYSSALTGLMLLLMACGGSEVAPTPVAPTPVAPTPVAPIVPVETPAPARAVSVVVLNDTDASVVLERSFGPAQPLSLARLDGPLDASARLDQQDDALSHRWVQTCECYCPGPCAECEPPMQVNVTLAPGERYTMAWSGMLRQPATGADCFEPVAPQAGHYVFSVCTKDDMCATRDVTLPAARDIELLLSHRESVTRCGGLNSAVATRLGRRVRDSVARTLRDRPVSTCPSAPTCVEPANLPSVLAQTRPGECALLAIPRGNEVEYRVFLPLPAT
ncbi:MAG: hypothetical protein GXP55_05235, partial [Deltaproteobacteria bacterium]|nr:hypothetical protein [Deltaproteobacteria bacterium]